jgi:CheY-like chemotaxis protein
VNVIERQAQHLVRLVDDLLDVSRITSGKVTLAKESVEIAEVVASAIETASPLIESARHTLVTDVPKEGMVVEVDRVRMAQVIANLLTNAAKYTPPGGRIRIAAGFDDGHIVIAVEDNGAGISAELLPKVFDLFVQARQTLARSQGGLGLGLTIVRSLVTMHGGSVTAESAGLAKGSRFQIRLPMSRVRASRPPSPATHRRVESRHERVLVVDDNTDAADSLALALRLDGYDTRVEYSGEEALRAASEFAPTAIVCDIGLPEMDGHEIARRLRADPGRAGTVLVAVTGLGSEEDKRRTQVAGFDFHLVKPVALASVQDILNRL